MVLSADRAVSRVGSARRQFAGNLEGSRWFGNVVAATGVQLYGDFCSAPRVREMDASVTETPLSGIAQSLRQIGRFLKRPADRFADGQVGQIVERSGIAVDDHEPRSGPLGELRKPSRRMHHE